MSIYNSGDTFKTKQGYTVTLIEKNQNGKWTVEFECGFRKSLYPKSVIDGTIRYPFHPTVYGVACIGYGQYKSGLSHKKTLSYQTWFDMIRRCYDKNNRVYNRYGGRGVTVCDDWLNFQNFAPWFYDNYVAGFRLDKDLTNVGCMEYSPDNCEFIPVEINNLLIANNECRGKYPVGVSKAYKGKRFQAECWNGLGRKQTLGYYSTPQEAFLVYKAFKEEVIKDVALRHFQNGNINEKIYNNLINWEVVEYPE